MLDARSKRVSPTAPTGDPQSVGVDPKGKPTALGVVVDDFGRNVSGDWTARHFSQANPEGKGQGDVPSLLRRVADTIDGLGGVRIMDLVMHNEITAAGDRPSIIVYYETPS